MRLALILALAASPATAWEFTPLPICTLSHETDTVAVEVTFDPGIPEYAIRLTRPEGWPQGPVFAIQFDGPRGLAISTQRHQIEGNELSVTDRGFGNVLDGLQYNTTAIALIGDVIVPVPLAGAAEPVAAFRDCPQNLALAR